MGGIVHTLRYKQGVEFQQRMLELNPLMSDYWSRHVAAPLDRIRTPMYLVASWTSNLRPYGTLRAWRKAASTEKWLRVHNTQEWPDQQNPENRDDLRRFFDHFLKGFDNGWETTPRVRLALLDPTGHDRVNVPFEDFPVPGTEYKRLHLDAHDRSLRVESPAAESGASYDVIPYDPNPRSPFSQPDYPTSAPLTDQVAFRFVADEDITLCGYFRAHLTVSTDAGSDMDLFIYVSKEDSLGQPYRPSVLGVDFMGAEGRFRVSHRRVESAELYDWRHEHLEEELIRPGKQVEIETVLWPLGMIVRRGEAIVLAVSASERQLFVFPTSPARTRTSDATLYTPAEARHPGSRSRCSTTRGSPKRSSPVAVRATLLSVAHSHERHDWIQALRSQTHLRRTRLPWSRYHASRYSPSTLSPYVSLVAPASDNVPQREPCPPQVS